MSFFLIRLGVMTLALAAAWAWMERPTSDRWSPLVLFGRTSLFVYWVHVALAYGAFSAPLHRALPFGWSLVAFGTLTLLMLGVAIWWSGRKPLSFVFRKRKRTAWPFSRPSVRRVNRRRVRGPWNLIHIIFFLKKMTRVSTFLGPDVPAVPDVPDVPTSDSFPASDSSYFGIKTLVMTWMTPFDCSTS